MLNFVHSSLVRWPYHLVSDSSKLCPLCTYKLYTLILHANHSGLMCKYDCHVAASVPCYLLLLPPSDYNTFYVAGWWIECITIYHMCIYITSPKISFYSCNALILTLTDEHGGIPMRMRAEMGGCFVGFVSINGQLPEVYLELVLGRWFSKTLWECKLIDLYDASNVFSPLKLLTGSEI
jgi:hypothetical protein